MAKEIEFTYFVRATGIFGRDRKSKLRTINVAYGVSEPFDVSYAIARARSVVTGEAKQLWNWKLFARKVEVDRSIERTLEEVMLFEETVGGPPMPPAGRV